MVFFSVSSLLVSKLCVCGGFGTVLSLLFSTPSETTKVLSAPTTNSCPDRVVKSLLSPRRRHPPVFEVDSRLLTPPCQGLPRQRDPSTTPRPLLPSGYDRPTLTLRQGRISDRWPVLRLRVDRGPKTVDDGLSHSGDTGIRWTLKFPHSGGRRSFEEETLDSTPGLSLLRFGLPFATTRRGGTG